MSLLLIGLNHKSANVSVREKLSRLCKDSWPNADGKELECVPVFTCNRVEIYYSGEEPLAESSFERLLESHDLKIEDFRTFLYRYSDLQAIEHLFRVAGGIDSMIVGENQILHQLKDAYNKAVQMGCVGKNLHALFQKALEVGKSIRSRTGISENTVSIASTAVGLARQIFGPLDECRALIIGAGEMASLSAVYLRKNGVGELLFTNRTYEKAVEMAGEYSGRACPITDLNSLLAESDIVITSTGANKFILEKPDLEKTMALRPNRPMFIIDIAVPRDVEPQSESIDNLFLFNIDDLQNITDENLDLRCTEAERAAQMAGKDAAEFYRVIKSFDLVPMIRAIQDRVELVQKAELEKLFSGNRDFTESQISAIKSCVSAISAKWLHNQFVNIKKYHDAGPEKLAILAEIFGAEPPENAENEKISEQSEKVSKE